MPVRLIGRIVRGCLLDTEWACAARALSTRARGRRGAQWTPPPPGSGDTAWFRDLRNAERVFAWLRWENKHVERELFNTTGLQQQLEAEQEIERLRNESNELTSSMEIMKARHEEVKVLIEDAARLDEEVEPEAAGISMRAATITLLRAERDAIGKVV